MCKMLNLIIQDRSDLKEPNEFVESFEVRDDVQDLIKVRAKIDIRQPQFAGSDAYEYCVENNLFCIVMAAGEIGTVEKEEWENEYDNVHVIYKQSKVHISSELDDAFFPCKGSHPYSYRAIHNIFRNLIQQTGIYYGGRGNGPRIHDIRHTFAVHRLKKWTLDGMDLSAMLPVLSTYMGHTDMNGTQHYLRLMADLYPHIQSALQHKFGHIVPDMGGVLIDCQ